MNTNITNISENKDQKKIEIKGKVYTLQQVPAEWYLNLIDKSIDKVAGKSAIFKAMLKNVVVDPPNLTINDFTGKFKELTDLVGECTKFIQGIDDTEDDDTDNF